MLFRASFALLALASSAMCREMAKDMQKDQELYTSGVRHKEIMDRKKASRR